MGGQEDLVAALKTVEDGLAPLRDTNVVAFSLWVELRQCQRRLTEPGDGSSSEVVPQLERLLPSCAGPLERFREPLEECVRKAWELGLG